MNNPEFTIEQNNNLKTWAEQRDFILLELSNVKNELEIKQTLNKELANSNSDIETRINENRGRFEELKIKEAEYKPVISKEIASLETTKSTLQEGNSTLVKITEILNTQKRSLENDISFALSTFGVVKDEALFLGKIVGKVTTVSKINTDRINILVDNLAKSLEEIIEVNKKNVSETNLVIDKLPRIIMELQKKKLINNKI